METENAVISTPTYFTLVQTLKIRWSYLRYNNLAFSLKIPILCFWTFFQSQLDTSTQQSKTRSSTSPSSIETRKPQNQDEINETISSHSLSISKAPDRISSPVSPSGAPSRLIPRENAVVVSDMNRQNYENELKGMTGKIRDVENEKYKVEMELANKIAELETKVGVTIMNCYVPKFIFHWSRERHVRVTKLNCIKLFPRKYFESEIRCLPVDITKITFFIT